MKLLLINCALNYVRRSPVDSWLISIFLCVDGGSKGGSRWDLLLILRITHNEIFTYDVICANSWKIRQPSLHPDCMLAIARIRRHFHIFSRTFTRGGALMNRWKLGFHEGWGSVETEPKPACWTTEILDTRTTKHFEFRRMQPDKFQEMWKKCTTKHIDNRTFARCYVYLINVNITPENCEDGMYFA